VLGGLVVEGLVVGPVTGRPGTGNVVEATRVRLGLGEAVPGSVHHTVTVTRAVGTPKLLTSTVIDNGLSGR
jgi:hypothetical protein